MFEYVREVILALEDDADVSSRQSAFAGLRQLGLDDFGEVLLSMPNPEYPKLSRLLPAMASEEVQRMWTGSHGVELLKGTAAFVRALSYNYSRIARQPLEGASVLDFGCGYGRIARLLYYFVDEECFWGLDPWDRSIELCHESGLRSNFLVSDYLPASLPVGSTRFNLIYAFSVFTHLSRRAATTSMRTLRQYVANDGLLVITIRPVEYWEIDPLSTPTEKRSLSTCHRETGFAFVPHNRPPVDGDVTYGDTSMTIGWMNANFPDWKIVATDRSLDDPFQLYVFMVPR